MVLTTIWAAISSNASFKSHHLPQGGFFSDVAAFTHGPANNLKPLTEMNRSLFILLKEKSCNTGVPFSSISVVMLGKTSHVGSYQSWSTTTVSLRALSGLCLAQLHRAEDVYLQPLSRQPLYRTSQLWVLFSCTGPHWWVCLYVYL